MESHKFHSKQIGVVLISQWIIVLLWGEERREYIYNGLVAGALRDGNSHDEAIAYANENIDDYAPVPWCGYVDWDDIMFKKEITRLMKPPFLVEQTNSNIIHLSLT